jgi:hypothetical protein
MNQNQTENRIIMPVFVFGRRRDVELETGTILAGCLRSGANR